MPPLPEIALPLPPNGPPPGYVWNDRDMSAMSSVTAFQRGLEARDRFLGEVRCVVCGVESVQHCHVIMQSEVAVWTDLKRRHWVPNQSKNDPANEPRNGLMMCLNHHNDFDQYRIFIRYDPMSHRFILFNYCGRRSLNQFHGKAIAIDINDQHAPFPSIFIIHEMRVRGHNPFQPTQPDLPNNIAWQDWLTSDDLLRNLPNPTNKFFKRDRDDENGGGGNGDGGEGNGNGGSGNGGGGTDNANDNERKVPRRSGRSRMTRQQGTMAASSSGTRKLELNAGVVADILAATHAMPSWKACQMENTSWSGTTDENIRRYVSSIGVEESLSSNAAERTG